MNNQQNDKEFWGNVKQQDFQSGDFMLKCGVKKEDLQKALNECNSEGKEWFNFDIKKSKAGNWYSEPNRWKPQSDGSPYQQPQQQAPQQTNPMLPPQANLDADSEIPF